MGFSWRNRKGAALILSLAILAVLTILGITFSQLMVVEREASANHSDGVRAKFAAQAGLEYGTAYLRKLARVKQFSEPVGDQWAWNPFYTDEQGRPVFDAVQAPAWVVGQVQRGATFPTVREDYTGYVHATYYEDVANTGVPGNYFQLRVQSCASQIYLNAHPSQLAGTENLLTNFIRAVLANGRTHIIPQPNGTTVPGRAFFAGLGGGERPLVREILRRRISDLPGGLFGAKEQLLQILQNIQTASPALLSGQTAEQVYADLKHFVTIHAWEDDSVLYLVPSSVSGAVTGVYGASVSPDSSLIYPGSLGGAPDPAPVAAAYAPYIPSDVRTYYACRELSFGGQVLPGRAPIDVNAACEEILTAVFADLRAERSDLTSATSATIPFATAQAIARDIVDTRTAASGNPLFDNYHTVFYKWDNFYGFLNSRTDLTHNQTDVIKAMCNPNSDINKFNPDTTLRKRFDKGDIIDIPIPGAIPRWPSFTTELCFGSMGYYDIVSVGKVLGSAGITTVAPTRAAVAARQTFNSVVRVYEIYRDTTQRDFETDRDLLVGLNDTHVGVPAAFGPAPNRRPIEVHEYSVLSLPDPRQNVQITNITTAGANALSPFMRPRRTDDTNNIPHDPLVFTGNEVHAAEYDGQLCLNGLINTEYFQSDNGFSNAQWAPYVVEASAYPEGQAFPVPVAILFTDISVIPPAVSFVFVPTEMNTVPTDYSLLGNGVYDDTGFLDFAAEGQRSMLVGFNLNTWAANVPVRDCIGSFGATDPSWNEPGTPTGDNSADYPLSSIVGPPGGGGSRTMRDGRNIYPLGFDPRANASDAFRTYLRYHNGNVSRFQGTIEVWVKPNHDFTTADTADLHRGTVLAYRNNYSNNGTVSAHTDHSGSGMATSALDAEVYSADDLGVSCFSDAYISNAFLLRFDSAYSMRAAIWGNNHFEGVNYRLVDDFATPTTTATVSIESESGVVLRSTPQVFATEEELGSSGLSTGTFRGIRCVPGKWQIVQMFYRFRPAIGSPPFTVLATEPPRLNEGNGYRFVWSLAAKGESSNISGVTQPGVNSWPNGTHPSWPSGSGPVVTSSGPLSASLNLNNLYQYCTTIWEDDFRGINAAPLSGPTGPLDKIEYIYYEPPIYPPDPFGAFDTPELRRRARWIFGAFLTAAASIRADGTSSTSLSMSVPGIVYDTVSFGFVEGPDPGPDSPLGRPFYSVDGLGLPYHGRWFGDAHPEWFDGRFRRTSYAVGSSALMDVALGGGIDPAGTSKNVLATAGNWELPGGSTTTGLAYATMDNLLIHPIDFSFEGDAVVDSSGGAAEDTLGDPISDNPSDPLDSFSFNDLQKRYWDVNHRFGYHSDPAGGHGFDEARYASGQLLACGVYKKYCREITRAAIAAGSITIGTVAFTTYTGNLPDTPSGWADTTNSFNSDFRRLNMDATLTGIKRLEYVSYLGSSGDVPGAAPDLLTPYNVALRVWRDRQAATQALSNVTDFEFPAAVAAGRGISAEPDGSGGASTSLDQLLLPVGTRPLWIVDLVLTSAQATAGDFISYSAGLNSDTLHAVAVESPFLDDVTITYLLPTSAILRYMEVYD
jgi:hypothetical protein